MSVVTASPRSRLSRRIYLASSLFFVLNLCLGVILIFEMKHANRETTRAATAAERVSPKAESFLADVNTVLDAVTPAVSLVAGSIPVMANDMLHKDFAEVGRNVSAFAGRFKGMLRKNGYAPPTVIPPPCGYDCDNSRVSMKGSSVGEAIGNPEPSSSPSYPSPEPSYAPSPPIPSYPSPEPSYAPSPSPDGPNSRKWLPGGSKAYSVADLAGSIAERVSSIMPISSESKTPDSAKSDHGIVLDVGEYALSLAKMQFVPEEWIALAKACETFSQAMMEVGWHGTYTNADGEVETWNANDRLMDVLPDVKAWCNAIKEDL